MKQNHVSRWLITAVSAVGLHAANMYVQHNLISDQAGVADHTDASLVNPWGIAASPTGP